jgi:exodeoxyribonuclease V alpha subunit
MAGLVEWVTFHNPENGFCALRVKARGHRDLVTVVGRAALISAGEFIQMSGTWMNNDELARPVRDRQKRRQAGYR